MVGGIYSQIYVGVGFTAAAVVAGGSAAEIGGGLLVAAKGVDNLQAFARSAPTATYQATEALTGNPTAALVVDVGSNFVTPGGYSKALTDAGANRARAVGAGVPPKANLLNYRLTTQGLGSNGGNFRILGTFRRRGRRAVGHPFTLQTGLLALNLMGLIRRQEPARSRKVSPTRGVSVRLRARGVYGITTPRTKETP